ncbi:ABC transporter ATP-binding protein [Flavitalea sp. BT771]|uniref:ABC transporter ATP-binding protein n=1 Tax=Flavitalea sp. BT771 TaxID=3063329 RepID=UPI0026E22206|nr:ABC transporter ATP-binding protein [Flavitalea sp. BT771]MDO6430070.1 ABC transporter ATP-binding protein [Flavitalea sp. BT771]MDV6219791.1 ABC transporter ATP-binding protein [Flavitalea sp. BT771]
MILTTEHLSHRYTSSWAIHDIGIQIEGTGIIGLLGSNGAGKSTTMNIICGTLNPTEGNVFIDGIDLRKHPEEAKKKIGYLPQTLPLYTDLTVDEYLIYCAELRMVAKDKIRPTLSDVKERCGITQVSSRLIKNLSGGYRQRVGIAQAIIHRPRLIVMDEPTNGLDPNQLIEARKLIKEIAEEHTVLLSSHVLSEVNLLCKEIIMIEAGRVVFSDSMDSFNSYIQSRSVVVRMENPPSKEELFSVRGVAGMEFITDKKLRIYFDGGSEITEKLIAASVAGNWRLQEISIDKGELDDIFKLISQQTTK